MCINQKFSYRLGQCACCRPGKEHASTGIHLHDNLNSNVLLACIPDRCSFTCTVLIKFLHVMCLKHVRLQKLLCTGASPDADECAVSSLSLWLCSLTHPTAARVHDCSETLIFINCASDSLAPLTAG